MAKCFVLVAQALVAESDHFWIQELGRRKNNSDIIVHLKLFNNYC